MQQSPKNPHKSSLRPVPRGYERLIGSVRREYLDHLLFWNELDLTRKLNKFKTYYNGERAHSSLDRCIPSGKAGELTTKLISINKYRWKSHAHTTTVAGGSVIYKANTTPDKEC